MIDEKKDVEGYIIMFENGEMYKVKTKFYYL
jgi:hypothetical protein